MPRKVLFFVATLLGPLIFAAWILTADSSDQIRKPENQEAPKDGAMEDGASRIDRAICIETGLAVKSAVDAIQGRVMPIDQGCKVNKIGIALYEVESSLRVADRRNPVWYTVVITEGIVDEKDGFFDGKWDKIKLHGFHRNFVSFPDFSIPNSRFLNLVEIETRDFLGASRNHRPMLRAP